MNTHDKSLAAQVRIGARAIELIKASVDPDDPDFAALVEQECDALERVRRILWAARSAEADSDALGTMIAEMNDRKARFVAKKDGLRQAARWALEELGLPGWKWPEFTVSLRPGKPGLRGAETLDPNQIADRFVTVRRELNRTALRDALEAGETIEGVYLTNSQPILTVRTK